MIVVAHASLRGRFVTRAARAAVAVVLASTLTVEVASAQARGTGAAPALQVDHTVPARPENLTWGDYPSDKAPIARVRSGQVVRIHTITHAGATQNQEPVQFMAQDGIPREEILQDQIDFWASREGRPREGRGGHVLTGPVYVEGAEPGDMLEIQILDLQTRVPWGVNNTGPTSGVFSNSYPGSREGDVRPEQPGGGRHVIRTGTDASGRRVAFFSPDIQIPLAPFMGIMAVSPENPTVGEPGVTVAGVQGSRPPGPFGGNMDLNELGVGATLYLPVFHPGALFYVGDPHSVQGDGEVSGTALEQSLTGVFRFVVHKGRTIDGPRAETSTHWLLMGIDLDLDRAMQKAVTETIEFLVEEKGMARNKAFSFSSLAVDFEIGEVVDLTQLVVGAVPKSLFPQR
jgi:acetamidase/formamidase